MNRNLILGTLGISLLLILSAATVMKKANSESANSSLPKLEVAESATPKTEVKLDSVVDAGNSFGFELFRQLPKQNNVVISPNSIAIALAMLNNGTAGETANELGKALELESLETQAINLQYQKLLETLTDTEGEVKMAIANSLWVNQNITLKDSFTTQAQKFYQAEVSNLDFSQPETTKLINDWVASNTANKIPQIIDAVSPEDALYLINAVYFKGSWTTPFDPSNTSEQPFYTQPDVALSKPMMTQQGDYSYFQNEQLQAIRLPYGEKQTLGMYILLPSKNSSLAALNQQLTPNNWQQWLSQMRSQSGSITLPRFQLEYETELNDALAALGIKQIFTSQGDFSALTDASVAVNTVKHKTFIEVNEEGTEAAATTSIGVRITSANPQPPFAMVVDRPFWFAIRDDKTKTILFMGNVVKPN